MFLIERKFWVESLRLRCYENHMNKNEIKDRMVIILESLKTNG